MLKKNIKHAPARARTDLLFRGHPGLETARRIHELARRVITRFVEDVIGQSARRLDALRPACVADIRAADAPVIAFSPGIAAADAGIKAFLFARMYRNPDVMAVRARANAIVRDLFEAFRADPGRMPGEWSRDLAGADPDRTARRIADYIAGMTDTYAALEHGRFFAATPDLRWRPASRGLPLGET